MDNKSLIVTPYDVLHGNLKSLIDWESEIQLTHLVHIQADSRFITTLPALEACLNLLHELTTKRKALNEREAVIYLVGTRLFNDIGASFTLSLKGYFQVALAIQRDIIEIGFLLTYFKFKPDEILTWKNADDKTLRRRYQPRALYEFLDEQNDGVLKDVRKSMYQLFCSYASHPTPKGETMIVKNGKRFIGPLDDARKVWNCIFELTQQSIFSAIYFVDQLKLQDKYIPLQLMYMKRSSEWSEAFKGVALIDKQGFKILTDHYGIS